MVIIGKGSITYIQVSKEVAGKLNEKKLVPRESYEDVLRRLLKMNKRIMIQKEKQ
jgi:predicted CopG family antitoxin